MLVPRGERAYVCFIVIIETGFILKDLMYRQEAAVQLNFAAHM